MMYLSYKTVIIRRMRRTVDFDQMLEQKVFTSDRKFAEETAYAWLKVCIIFT